MVEKGKFTFIDFLVSNIYRSIGLIYRNYRPVHYSPSSRSALAEAELEYHDNHVSRSVYVVFDVENSLLPAISPLAEICKHQAAKLLVWTTTPWTLTANMVCQ